MPGALSGAFAPDPTQPSATPQQGGALPNYGTYAAATDPAAINNPYIAAMLARGGGGGNDFAQAQGDYAAALRGPGSPVDQIGALQRDRDAAAAQKVASINRAMTILRATQANQSSNLPLLAAAGAMLQPTRTGTFAESLGNGFQAATPVAQRERARQLQIAGAEGQLAEAAGSVPLQITQQDIEDFWNRQKLAEQAGQGAALVGGRLSAAQIGAGARVGAAQVGAAVKPVVAGIQAGGQENRGLAAEKVRAQAQLQATMARIQASAEARAAQAKLREDGIAASQASNIMNNATRAAAADPDYLSGKKPLSAFIQEQLAGRKAAVPSASGAAPAAPPASAPGGVPIGTIATNKAGQKLRWTGTKWEDASPAPAPAPAAPVQAAPAPAASGAPKVGDEKQDPATGRTLMWTGMKWLPLGGH